MMIRMKFYTKKKTHHRSKQYGGMMWVVRIMGRDRLTTSVYHLTHANGGQITIKNNDIVAGSINI